MTYNSIKKFIEDKADGLMLREIMKKCDMTLSTKDNDIKESVTQPEDVLCRISWIKWEEQEHLIVICLNSNNEIIGIHDTTKGLVNQTPVHPRESFKQAIKDNATCVMFAHNHPSGNLEPSDEDMNITKVLCAAGKILMIPVLDHIIISKRGFTSLCRRYPEIFEDTFYKEH